MSWTQNGAWWEFTDAYGLKHVVPIQDDGIDRWYFVPGHGVMPVPQPPPTGSYVIPIDVTSIPAPGSAISISSSWWEMPVTNGMYGNIPSKPVWQQPVVASLPVYIDKGKIAADAFQAALDDERSRDQLAKNYDALGGSRQTGILRPQTEDPDAGKDVPAEAIPARADEPEDPAERPLTKAILDEWMRRWV